MSFVIMSPVWTFTVTTFSLLDRIRSIDVKFKVKILVVGFYSLNWLLSMRIIDWLYWDVGTIDAQMAAFFTSEHTSYA